MDPDVGKVEVPAHLGLVCNLHHPRWKFSLDLVMGVVQGSQEDEFYTDLKTE